MAGGLLQLIAFGTQDVMLTKNPEFTFFKIVYHRHTNFSKFTDKINLSKKGEFESVNNINIPKNADLLDNIYISVNLPSLNVVYEREVYEDIYYKLNNTTLDESLKFINKTEYNNLNQNIKHLKNFLNNEQYYDPIITFTDNTNTANNMIAGIINTSNLLVNELSSINQNIYYYLNKELVSNFELNSSLFNNFSFGSTLQLDNLESFLKVDFNTVKSEDYFQKLLLNMLYNNNSSSILNYLNFKKDFYEINTPNKFLESIYFKMLTLYSINNYNILSLNLLSFSKSISYGKSLDYDYAIYGTNTIEISYDGQTIFSNNKASDYDVIFINNTNEFNLKSIKSILIKSQVLSTTNEIILYILKENSFTLNTTFGLSNYLEVDGWSNNNTKYVVNTKNIKANSDNVYELVLDSVSNLEINQIIFGFNNSLGTVNSTPDFMLKVSTIYTDSNKIDVKIFDNKLHANNLNKKNYNNDDYNSYELMYLSNGIRLITPISCEMYKSDIFNNYEYINSNNNTLISGLSQSDYYSNIIKYSKTVISNQYQILSNHLNSLFQNNIYLSIKFNVDAASSAVENFYETSIWQDSYDSFVKPFLYNTTSNTTSYTTDISITPEFLYNKFVNRVTKYLLSSDLNSYLIPNFKNSFGITLTKGFDTYNELIPLINKIQYLRSTSPFLTILLTTSTYYNTTTNALTSPAETIAVDDTLHLYNAGTEGSTSNLIGVFKIIKVDTYNTNKITLVYESYNTKYNGYEIDITKINSLTDGAYLFKTTTSNTIDVAKRLTINGSINDESSYIFTITQSTNNYMDFSSDPNGSVTSNFITPGRNILVSQIIISGGNVTSITVLEGGGSFSTSDTVTFKINSGNGFVSLGAYTINTNDLTNGLLNAGNLNGTMPTNSLSIADGTYNNSNSVITHDKLVNFYLYESSTKSYSDSTSVIKNKLSLFAINPNTNVENVGRQYISFLDSRDDNNFLIDTSTKTYFCFKENESKIMTISSIVISNNLVQSITMLEGGGTFSVGETVIISIDNGNGAIKLGEYSINANDLNTGVFKSGNLNGTMPNNLNNLPNGTYNNENSRFFHNLIADKTNGFVINSVTVNGRYYSLNSLETTSQVDSIKRGYKYTNVLYNIYCLYLYDQLKSKINQVYNRMLFTRLHVIATKIFQINTLSTGYNNSLENLTNTIKLTYFADFTKIFNSGTILNEVFNNFSSTYLIELKKYLHEKYFDTIDNSIVTRTTYSLSGTVLTKVVGIVTSTVNDSDVTTELKQYFKINLEQLTDSYYQDITDISLLNNINDKKLYFVAANNIVTEHYINIINNIYYDNIATKRSKEIGILLNEHINDSVNVSVKDSDIRNVIESNVLLYTKNHILNTDTFKNRLDNRYFKLGVSTSFGVILQNYLNNETLLNNLKNIDLPEKLSTSDISIKSDIYTNLGLSVGSNTEFDTQINNVFSHDERRKSIYSFINENITYTEAPITQIVVSGGNISSITMSIGGSNFSANDSLTFSLDVGGGIINLGSYVIQSSDLSNGVFVQGTLNGTMPTNNGISDGTYTTSNSKFYYDINEVCNFLHQYIFTLSLNQIFNIIPLFFKSLKVNRLVNTNNLTLSILNTYLTSKNENTFENLIYVSDSTNIYIPTAHSVEFKNKLKYINSLNTSEKTIEEIIWIKETSGLHNAIKNYYFTYGSTLKSVKSLEDFINGSNNYFADNNGSGVVVSQIIISGGDVTSITISNTGGSNYVENDLIIFTINNVKLGVYKIVAGNLSSGSFASGTLSGGVLPINENKIIDGTYTSNLSSVLLSYKLYRGCILSSLEFASLNVDPIECYVFSVDTSGGITKLLIPFNLNIFLTSTSPLSSITLSLTNSILRIQSNNNPAPATNSLTITDKSFDFSINCRFGLNIKEETDMTGGNIGVSLNGVILRNPYIQNTPTVGLSASITNVIILGGIVTSITMSSGGSNFAENDTIIISINGVSLGGYIIKSTDLNSGAFVSGTLDGIMPLNFNGIVDGTYTSNLTFTNHRFNSPDSFYELTLDSLYYYNYSINSYSNKLISVGDVLSLYSSSLISNTTKIINVLVTSSSNNVIKFRSQYNVNIKNEIYGYKVVSGSASLSFGFKVIGVSSESFRLNLLSYISEFSNNDTNVDAVIDEDNFYNYYSGRYINGLSSVTNDYLASSTLNLGGGSVDKLRYADGHSKILGISNDGYPIYGPYGYSKELEVGNVEMMKSSYKIKSIFSDNRIGIILVNGGSTLYDTGTMVEDYEYVSGLGHLDESNGRFCITPEFPNGTYAYFMTYNVGNSAEISSILISGGNVQSVTMKLSGNNYIVGDRLNIIINSVRLGSYTIVDADLNNGKFKEGNLTGTMPQNPNSISNSTYTSNISIEYNSTVPKFPYIIGNKYYNKPDVSTTSDAELINNSITLSSNVDNFTSGDIVNLVGDNGKYGKGTIKTSTNNIKYIDITDKGIHYSASNNVYTFKDISSTLEYVDENKLFIRRKARFYDGYYYDYTNSKLNILNGGDSTSQTTFTNSMNKVSVLKSELNNLVSKNTMPTLSIVSVYDTTKYETILNIMNVDDIISILSSLSPQFFGSNLSTLLINDIESKNNFNNIINDLISKLYNRLKIGYELYYTDKINVSKDYNLKDLDLVKYSNIQVSDTRKEELKEDLIAFESNLNKNLVEYDKFKLKENGYLTRSEIPSFSWVNNVGIYLFDEIDLYLNDLLIDRQYSTWVNIWHNLNDSYDKKELLEKMLGNTKELTEISNKEKPSKKLMIPLRFWFCRYSGHNLPLIAMPYVDINLKLKINSLNKLVRKDEGTKVILGSDMNINLLVNYVYLDETERKIFAEARHEYLIEQIQFNGFSNIIGEETLFNIYFRNNIREIYWICDHDKNLLNKDLSNYSISDGYDSGNPVSKTKILVNAVKFIECDGMYSNYIVPYEKYKSTPSDGINVYKFGLEDEAQPNGSLNFSMLDKAQMSVTVNNSYLNNDNKKILVFANSYNVLRIMSGLAGLAFIE